MKNISTMKTAAYLVAACLAAQPAFAGPTDISNVPLGSSAGLGLLPNLLFILDDSGSMASDYNPDYVNDSNTCMTNSSNSTACQRGDPPFEAGGATGFNGVGYDPNFTYLPGLTATGVPIINPGSTPTAGQITTTSVTPDAYLGGTAVNVTNNIRDKIFCNSVGSNPPCKRNGADATAAAVITPAGTKDPEGTSLAAGQFPYRANVSSKSTINFGLPEMMTTASFTRSGSTVTATVIGKPSLAANDKVYVTTGSSGLNVTCATVTGTTATTFTYTTGTSGTIGATNGSYRKCDSGTWVRVGSVVTVTLINHGLQTNDLLLIDSNDNNQDKTTATAIAVVDANNFTYSGSSSGSSLSSGTVSWVRTGLYNVMSTSNGAPPVYSITPVEWCSDVNLTICKEFIPPIVPPAKPGGADAAFSNPAYVRFCKTQADALAPGAVTGNSGTTARCQLKFVNQSGLTNYIFPRYGWFTRDTVAPGLTFRNRPNRSDCVTSGTAPDCTYNEEIQNYAKWYAYYRTRMQMMKTSAGRAFLPFISNPTATPAKPDRLRVGFITINPTFRNSDNSSTSPNVDSSKYLRIDNFSTTQASNWYTKFYSIIPNNSTPLRLALSRAGWIYAGKMNTGLTAAIPAADDPIQASCQKNYAFLTTDGFWNQGAGKDLVNNDIGQQDNQDNDSRFNSAPAPNPYAANPARFFSSRASGTFDGGTNNTVASTTPGASGTLADIALYYYRNDLRGGTDLAGNATGPNTSPSTTPPGGDVSTNNVDAKSASVDFARHQHMTTFSIGLADGLMRYQPDYDTDTNSDFFHIVNADSGKCFWNGAGTCNWPLPVADGQSALDDLWHAAVNGRGFFYSAVNPVALANGLTSALNKLDINVASAAAAATSSPQVSEGNAKAFSTTYQTSTWSGEIYAQAINPTTGEVITTGANNGKLWEAHKLLVDRVNGQPLANPPVPPGPARKLWTLDVGANPGGTDPAPGPNKLKPFVFTSLSSQVPVGSTEQQQFKNKCLPSTWAQCNSLSLSQLSTANGGPALVDFLSGKSTFEGTIFRDRTEQDPVTGAFVNTILGDIINAQPVAVGKPFLDYQNEPPHAKYAKTAVDYLSTFKDPISKTRRGFLLVGSNDGFLHAFDQTTGQENWAYVPRFLLPNLSRLADSGYPGLHQFYVDGTPEVADVFDANASAWKTIVVGGTNAGGRGYYALDITDEDNPKGLWEFCASLTWCPNDLNGGFPHSDPDLGFSYGNPVIGRRDVDGKWVVVVTSGLNNIGPGDGRGYFFVLDAITGQILNKIGTGVGDITTPSGLMKIGAYYPVGQTDPNFTHVYGGDQFGNVWRVDLTPFPQDNFGSTLVTYTGPTSITTDAHIIGRLATFKDASGRFQPITARPAGTHLGADPYNPDTRIYYVGTGRYIGNSDLTDQGAGGVAWQQSIYGVRDQLDNAGFAARPSFRTGNAVQQTLQQAGQGRTISKNFVDWKTQDGFFIDLNPTFANDPATGNSPGERVFLDVRLISGTLIITSNVPNAGGACVPGGHSFQYNLDFRTGGYVGNDSTAIAGNYITEFLVGAAIEQTSDLSVKALNKSITGENLTTPIQIDRAFLGKRFSYRER
jgi:type IV pilus assembly protein PilY1